MSRVEIFDPAMCCSTGVCGHGVAPELLRVATIISNLQKIGKDIVTELFHKTLSFPLPSQK